MPSSLQDHAAFVVEEPNEHHWLVRVLSDPARLADYLATKCVTEQIQRPRAFNYIYWFPNDDYGDTDDMSTMVQCVDNFGASDDFERCCRCCHVSDCIAQFSI